MAGIERPLDRPLLLPLRQAVIAGRLRLVVVHLPDRVDDLVVHVVDHVAADAGLLPTRQVDDDYYAFLATRAGSAFRLHCEELTGQTDRADAARRQVGLSDSRTVSRRERAVMINHNVHPAGVLRNGVLRPDQRSTGGRPDRDVSCRRTPSPP